MNYMRKLKRKWRKVKLFVLTVRHKVYFEMGVWHLDRYRLTRDEWHKVRCEKYISKLLKIIRECEKSFS